MDDQTIDTRHDNLGNFLIYLCAAALLISAAVKFLALAKPVAYMRYLGYEHVTLFFVAGLELLTLVVFLLPPTRAAGLLLVSAYFGGAIAAHLANHPFTGGGPFLAFNARHHYLGTLPASLFLIFAWTGVWLRHPQSLWSFRGRTE